VSATHVWYVEIVSFLFLWDVVFIWLQEEK
jgi:hypothetical protein